MDRQQEEDVLRITAQYVAELQAGQQPRLSDYLVRYPHYADVIADFVTYYHAVEADLPVGALSEAGGGRFNSFAPSAGELTQLSETSRAALERAWEHIELHETIPTNLNTTLLSIANKQSLSMSQLADGIGLSRDIVEKFAGTRLLIDPATIPQEVLRRLAHILHQPLGAIQSSLSLSSQPSNRLQMAEARASYHAEHQPASHVQSFREAIEQSAQLSGEQKATWRDILAREGL